MKVKTRQWCGTARASAVRSEVYFRHFRHFRHFRQAQIPVGIFSDTGFVTRPAFHRMEKKSKMKFPRLLIILLGLILINAFSHKISYVSASVHFTDVTHTMTECKYAGKMNISGMPAENGEDEVGVFISDGNGGEIQVGAAVMGDLVADYYFLRVYGDDPITGEKDGAYNEETLIFKVWDKSGNREYVVPPADPYMTYGTDEDLLPPQVPPVWDKGTAIGFGLLNLSLPVFPGDVDGSGDVGLRDAILAMKVAVHADIPHHIYTDADIGGDEKIGIQEAVYALQLAAGLRNPIE